MPTLRWKAKQALLHSLVRGHPLVDGNKRLGWLAAVVFLDINGQQVDLDDDAAFDLVMAAAEGRFDAGCCITFSPFEGPQASTKTRTFGRWAM